MLRRNILPLCMLLATAVANAADQPAKKPATPQTSTAVANFGTLPFNTTLATVDGAIITLSDIVEQCRELEFPLHATLRGKELDDAVLAIRRKVLADAIDRKLILADYETVKFKIPEQYVENHLDNMAENAGTRSRREFAAKVRAAGSNIETLRTKSREALIIQAMRSRYCYVAVNITPKEVYDYFVKNKAELGKPEFWNISLLKIDPKRENRAEVIAEITERLKDNSPATFAAMAGAYSSGANAAGGGALGDVKRSALRKDFSQAMTEPAAGKIYGPLHTDDGTYFLMLNEIVSPVAPDFRKHELEIRRKMEEEARRAALDKYTGELRAMAIIEYFI